MAQFDFARFLNIKAAYAPAFAEDGNSILFVSDITGVPQVWSIDAPLAWPKQITFGSDRFFSAYPNPQGDRVIVTGDVGGNENVQLTLLSPDGATATPIDYKPSSAHNFSGWSPDGKSIVYSGNSRNPAAFDVYTLAVDDPEAEPVLVYQRDGTVLGGEWSPDGKSLIVGDLRTFVDNDLYQVSLQGDAPRLLTPHEGEAFYSSVQWSASGKSIYLVTDAEREFAALMKLDLETLAWEEIAAPSWDVEACQISPDGQRLAYTVNAGGYTDFIVRDLASGAEMRPDNLPRGLVASPGGIGLTSLPFLSWSPDSKLIAFNFQSPARNSDIWVWDLENNRAEAWTRSGMAAIPASTFVEPELIEYPTFDERQIPAFFYLPATEQGKLAPCVVYVHGGPESQTQANFNTVIQYFVHRGYAVLAPNVRGSTGYGREYTHLDDVRLRMDSVKDLAAGVEWLASSGRVDPQKIVVMGGSYGGFMVLAAITAYPDLWAAGVDIVGIANFETFLRNTAVWRRHLREAEYGSLEHDLDFLREVSPIYYVDKITAPLFVIHGANDPRVPVSEAEQMVASLRSRNHPVEYLVFDDEGHGLAKLKNKLVAYPAIGDFLDKHLGS